MKQKKTLSILVVFALVLTTLFGSLSVGAASVADATIDTTKTANLDIYKYDITAAKEDGVWSETSYESTGVRDESGVEAVLGNPNAPKTLPNGDTSYGYAIKGVEFTYLKVADITTISLDGTVQVLFGFDKAGTGETMLAALGLSWADRVTAADTATTYYFASETLIDGLSASLTANATTVKDALESYVKTNNGTVLAQTDSYGHTSAKDIALGLYLIVETKVPEYVTTPTAPFFVTLPMTSVNGTNATDGGERWIYDVTVYPKNETGDPTLEKTVREDKEDTGKNDGTTDDITDGYAHTATGSDGDVMEYQIISTLPHITSTASHLTTYTFVDTLAKGLTYNRDVKIEWYTDAACTDLITTWTLTDTAAKYAVTYGAADNTMRIEMTAAGLAEINSANTVYTAAGAVDRGYSACTMRIVYSATINSDATVVYGDDGNPNEVELTWKRTSTSYFDTLDDCCHVFTYAIDLTKEFSVGNGDFSKVTFSVFNDTDDYFVKAELKNGIYYVTDHVTAEADATKFVPTADGSVVIKGLEDDTYIFTELTTDNSYTLLKEAITVNITSVAGTVECSNCHALLPTASATVDGNAVAMEADNSSVNAIVPFKVINHKQIVPPVTGEAGVVAVVCGGCALMALSVTFILLCTRKKDKKAGQAN